MKWLTWENVGVDRMASAWLITRFIDNQAEFLFVPASQVEQVAKEPGLLRLAKIVHGADVSEDIDKEPLARGLEAIASGFSLRFPEDEENLTHQFDVYDALYAWCRLDVARNK
jgi:hypothetical protein